MSADFIQMISDWNARKYSLPNIAENKVPCGFFVAPEATPAAEKYIDQFFKANKLNLTCVCFMDQRNKEVFRPIAGIKIVFILDRSSSMAGLESDTIGGFNSMIKKQQTETEGNAFVSTMPSNT